jgi:two-component system, NarL family, sensor histidine kinase DesK
VVDTAGTRDRLEGDQTRARRGRRFDVFAGGEAPWGGHRASRWDPWWSLRGRRVLTLLWLGILVAADVHIFRHGVSSDHRATVLVLNAVIIAVVLGDIFCPPRAWAWFHGALLPASVAVLWTAVIVLAVVDGSPWLFAFTYTVIPAVRSGRRAGFVVLPASAVLALIVGLGIGEQADSLIGTVISVLGTGAIVFGFSRLVRANHALREAQEERAALAVSEERSRFARDLHDLLGHSLSVIALKSELTSRLLPGSPERAAAEVNEIERVARGALREVREAVSGYRRPTLAVELAGARSALAAAGVSWNLDVGEGSLPEETEAVLAWTVREGVTNVMRHSQAEHCTVRVMADGEAATVVITDDGVGSNGAGTGTGNGLRGLAERVHAAGGNLEAGPRPAGGFRLRVSIPVPDHA